MKILTLKIDTPDVERQLRFYRDLLNLPVLRLTRDSFEVNIGFSRLEFHQNPKATPYHIAMHIPSERIKEAADWLEQRVPLLYQGTKKIIDFPAWDAQSVYFYDNDKNIIEFISRTSLFPRNSAGFSSGSLLGISEVGVATEQVTRVYQFLNSHFGLEKHTGDYQEFCATGDDLGLFIIINRDKKDWIPTGDKAFGSPFEVHFSRRGEVFYTKYNKDRFEPI